MNLERRERQPTGPGNTQTLPVTHWQAAFQFLQRFCTVFPFGALTGKKARPGGRAKAVEASRPSSRNNIWANMVSLWDWLRS
jgi:hypothetical protein